MNIHLAGKRDLAYVLNVVSKADGMSKTITASEATMATLTPKLIPSLIIFIITEGKHNIGCVILRQHDILEIELFAIEEAWQKISVAKKILKDIAQICQISEYAVLCDSLLCGTEVYDYICSQAVSYYYKNYTKILRSLPYLDKPTAKKLYMEDIPAAVNLVIHSGLADNEDKDVLSWEFEKMLHDCYCIYEDNQMKGVIAIETSPTASDTVVISAFVAETEEQAKNLLTQACWHAYKHYAKMIEYLVVPSTPGIILKTLEESDFCSILAHVAIQISTNELAKTSYFS